MAAPGEGKEAQAPFPSLSDKKRHSGPGATMRIVCVATCQRLLGHSGHVPESLRGSARAGSTRHGLKADPGGPLLARQRGASYSGLTQGKGRGVA